MLLLAFLIKGAVLVVGDVVDGRLDLDWFLLGPFSMFGWQTCIRILYVRVCTCTRLCTLSFSSNTDTYII
jgi:hypothetical protein